jgi:hypothetical protein
MHDNRDDHEPIIATRRSREPLREDKQPLWRLIVALAGGLAVAALIAWWLIGRLPGNGASTTALTESSAPEIRQEEHIEQAPLPPARDSETNADIGQALTPENIPVGAPDNVVQAPVPPAPMSVRFMSPDTQVRIELRGPLDSSPPVTSRVGDVVSVAPGTYRVVASGTQLETFELEVQFDGERSLEYTIELCAERKHERESLAGQVVEKRECASAEQCESTFTVLSEHAGKLVKDRAFRTQQCAKWRPKAAPHGKWTLDTECGGATLATVCRIEIAEGACTFAEPRRSVRGSACPRVALK